MRKLLGLLRGLSVSAKLIWYSLRHPNDKNLYR